MDMLATALRATGFYSDKDVLLFEKEVLFKEMPKDTLLLGKGEVCQSAFFLLKGAFYQYTDKDDIDQQIIDLHLENEWFLNASSFIAQQPSDTYLKAYADCTVLELTITSIHRLIGLSPAFFQLGRILDQAKERIHFFDNLSTPSEKYAYILEQRRQLLHRFSLKMIASYLKMSPETLSRVREKLARDKPIS